MADLTDRRPFDNFRVAITDPNYFFGHENLLMAVQRSPFQVRILLGGRRIGKTSFLRAVEWNLLKLSNTDLSDAVALPQTTKIKSGWMKKTFPTFSKFIDSSPKVKNENLSDKQTNSVENKAFPVFISLQVEQPNDLDSFRYLLIARLRETMNRWRSIPTSALRIRYREFLTQVDLSEITVSFLSTINLKFNIKNPNSEKKLSHDDFRKALLATINELRTWQIDGVCFLLDGSEFVVSQSWANDAWSYLRGLKDTDTALKPFVGFVFSGYRNLRDYQQAVGSPLLNISEVSWLTALTTSESKALITQRNQSENLTLTDTEQTTVLEWGGGHPYLTQQLINLLLNGYGKPEFPSLDNLKCEMLRQHDRDFSAWWNDLQRPYSLGEIERKVYNTLIECRQEETEHLSQKLQISYGEVADALEVLVGAGVIHKVDDELHQIGSQLFEEWVKQQKFNT